MTEVEQNNVVEELNESTEVDRPKVIVEKDEDELFRMRAKLFRWAKEADPPEWKERGTGDVTLLKHKETSKIRLLMRREKTYKTCANHYLDPGMKLQANIGSDRAWVWTAYADFADEEPKEELLAIRFKNTEIANSFKEKFVECQDMMKTLIESCQEKLIKKLCNLKVEEQSAAAADEDENAAGEKDEEEDAKDEKSNTDLNCSGEKTVTADGESTAKSEQPSSVKSSVQHVEDVPEN